MALSRNDKELLLKDLCARLPHGVKVILQMYDGTSMVADLTAIEKDGLIGLDIPADVAWNLEDIKPYLRPMSSMTEEEKAEEPGGTSLDGFMYTHEAEEYIDWLNAHHFDYRNLIGKGLAIEAPNDMYKI